MRPAGYSNPKWPTGKWSKLVGDGDTFELEYEAETPNSEGASPLYLSETLSQQLNAQQAREDLEMTLSVMTAMFKSQKMSEKLVPKQLVYGDSSRLTILQIEGLTVGNLFTARRKGRTFTLMMVGVSFKDAKKWDAFAGKKIRAWLSAAK